MNKKIENDCLIHIIGGSTTLFTASFLSAIVRGLNTILELGRSIGTAISRINNNNICK